MLAQKHECSRAGSNVTLWQTYRSKWANHEESKGDLDMVERCPWHIFMGRQKLQNNRYSMHMLIPLERSVYCRSTYRKTFGRTCNKLSVVIPEEWHKREFSSIICCIKFWGGGSYISFYHLNQDLKKNVCGRIGGLRYICCWTCMPSCRGGDAWRSWALPAEGTHSLSLLTQVATWYSDVQHPQHTVLSVLLIGGELLCKDKSPACTGPNWPLKA